MRTVSQSNGQLRPRSDLHLLRKAWHMGTGLTGLAFYLALSIEQKAMALSLISFAIVAFVFELLRISNEKINSFVLKIMGPFMRESERNGFSGFPFYALGTGISLFLFEEKIAILSILFLVFADPISSFFGVTYGREKILPNKSIQGSFAGFVTCYFVAVGYGFLHGLSSVSLIWFSIVAGVVGSFSELLSIFVDDNLTIPIVSGAGLTVANIIFQLF